MDKETMTAWLREVLAVLNREWDPIGVPGLPQDEYTHYARDLIALLRRGASDNEIMDYLRWAETVNMGLSVHPFDERQNEKVVAALRLTIPPTAEISN